MAAGSDHQPVSDHRCDLLVCCAGGKNDYLCNHQQGIAFGKKAANTFVENLENRSLGFAGKAFGEGLEEVTEEAVTDISKGFYSLLGDLGLYEASVENPIDWNTALERYGMSFIGGTLGGGLFYGIDKYNGYNEHRDRDLVELIMDGHADKLREFALKRANDKKVGSTTLSGINYQADENGAITWLSTNDEKES